MKQFLFCCLPLVGAYVSGQVCSKLRPQSTRYMRAHFTGYFQATENDTAATPGLRGTLLLHENTVVSARLFAGNPPASNHIEETITAASGTAATDEAYAVTTVAGKPAAPNEEPESLSHLHSPAGIATDMAGNIYIADAEAHQIRKITPDGIVTTLAGNGVNGYADGQETKASFSYPSGVTADASGNVYVADKGNHRIRKITPAGVVSTLAGNGKRADKDGKGISASFDKPVAIAIDKQGCIYVADQCNHKIKKISTDGWVSTLAGSGSLGDVDGTGSAASFYSPAGLAVDSLGNVYVADYGNNRIRKITASGVVSTLTGSDIIGSTDGNAAIATFYFPDAVAIDSEGNLLIADQVNNKIRKLTLAGRVTTLAGDGTTGSRDGSGLEASFSNPSGVAVDGKGQIYVADYSNGMVRKIESVKRSHVQP